jgi:hypothetical protein
MDSPSRLGVVATAERSAGAIAALSRTALDRPLRCAAELAVSIARDDALLAGAFQRGAGLPDTWPLLRRGSGGPEVRVGAGSVHIALALEHPASLVACDERRIVNRYVRPLLRALTRAGSLAHYFGRDWVSVEHRPAGWVGFAHDATTRRTLFEAVVAVDAPFAVTQRASFLGKPHGPLRAILGTALDPARVAAVVVDAYAACVPSAPPPLALDWPLDGPEGRIDAAADDPRADPPWAATVEEAIGTVGAGPDARGAFRVGGDLLVSRDALARLESRAAAAPEADLPRVVDETLAAPGVALDGVRSLASVLDVISRARAGAGARHG